MGLTFFTIRTLSSTPVPRPCPGPSSQLGLNIPHLSTGERDFDSCRPDCLIVGKACEKTWVERGVGLAFLVKPEENTVLFPLLIQEFMDVDVGV